MLNTIDAVPLSEFFPFGSTANDQRFPANDDSSTNGLPLPRIFPYFNNNHRQIYLANNGLFSFLGPITQYVPTPFPLSDGRRLIAGFWSDIDTRGNIASGNEVYYHIYDNGDNNTVFNKAMSYVQQYFPGERSFTPSMIITGTWYRVGAYSMQTTRTNTFQIVLATDEIRSFAFILYHELQWASPQGASDYSNAYNEIGGQAGFNAGDGIVFQMLPYSRTSRVRLLSNISNVNVPGLFVFRIDTDTIAVGGCGNNSNLLFRPRRGSQLGSTAITVQGPCFRNRSEGDIKCRFGDSMVVDAIVISEFQAICLTPSVPLPDFTNVYLSIDGGITYQIFPSTLTYTRAEYGYSSIDNSEVIVVNSTDTVLITGNRIALQWYLSERTINNWPNNTMRLEIQMWNITLNESNGGIIHDHNTVLQTDIIPILGIQSTSIIIPSIRSNKLQVIFLRIVARDTSTNITYAGLNSALFVLYDNTTDPTDHCQSWGGVQPSPSTWNENLIPCPLTLAQARVARCCYEIDPLCTENNLNSSMNCRLHQGRSNYNESSAVACYLSRTTNQQNVGAECCYDNQGQLITRGTGGGTDDRYRPASLPILHLFNDLLPYLACCHLNYNATNCETYFSYRPHRRGSNSPNSWGGTWGDPHFTTLDGTTYTFNGYGEYTYLAVTDSLTSVNTAFNPSTQNIIFNSQVRTAPFGSSTNRATVIRGFAAKSNDSLAQTMSITLSRREILIVRRGNDTLDLDLTNDDSISSNNSLILFFPEMTLEKNRTNGILTLSWFLGISIQITPISITNGLVLNIAISVAGIYQKRTFGLLGLYDNNSTNDLRALDGTIIGLPNTLTLQQIHQQFGQTWSINPSRSLFYYETGDSALNYANQNLQYVPSFIFPEPSSSQLSSTLAACGIDPLLTDRSRWNIAQQTCYYDIAVTNDIALGQSSRIAADTISQIAIDQRYPPEFNSTLPLILTVNKLSPVTINFTADSPYTTSILYNLVQGPSSASFNNETAIFHWPLASAIDTNTVVRVSAQDTLYNLLSTHEIVIRVISPTPPSHCDIISVSWIFMIINIVGTFFLTPTF